MKGNGLAACFKEPAPLPRKRDKIPRKLLSPIPVPGIKTATGLMSDERAQVTMVLEKDKLTFMEL